MADETPNDRLRTRSGKVRSSDPLVSVLYTLVRDHIQPGTLEKVIQEEETIRETHHTMQYSNGYLARYCEDVAARIYGLKGGVGISPIQTEE
jgi:hypothetical protein